MRHEVTDADTAAALGSGTSRFLGTPRLIAWTESATVRVWLQPKRPDPLIVRHP